MKCPDCGSRLGDVVFGPGERGMRCFRCGGFWLDSGTINRLSARQLSNWRRISIDRMWVRSGKGVCPLDSTMLTRYTGEALPMNITAMRCVRCGKWWFPGDSLFAFKPVVEAKASYSKVTGQIGDLGKLGLPVVVAIILVGGVVAGVNLVRTRTQNAIPAAETVRKVAVSYVGDGQAVATFIDEGGKVGLIKYRLNQIRPMSRANESSLWSEAEVTCVTGVCQGKLINLDYGKEYVLRVGEKDYLFVAQ